MIGYCETLRDAWNFFVELHGENGPIWTQEELRDWLHVFAEPFPVHADVVRSAYDAELEEQEEQE